MLATKAAPDDVMSEVSKAEKNENLKVEIQPTQDGTSERIYVEYTGSGFAADMIVTNLIRKYGFLLKTSSYSPTRVFRTYPY